MKSNSFSKYFGITTFGESHGDYMGVVIEDILPNIDFPTEKLKIVLSQRKPNNSEFSSQRAETDDFEIISGVFEGKTTGMPICILFKNKDFNTKDYEFLKNIFRPGHADFSWFHKFKIYDYRGGGRASGRETISRVAASSLINHVLGNIKILSYPVSIGNIKATEINIDFMNQNHLKWGDKNTYNDLINDLQTTKNEKDSLGAIIEINIMNVPIGLGDPVFEKLDANLAKAIMSIGAIKGIEFGCGFALSEMKGSISNISDQGGIAGGISDGKNIKLRVAVKPVSSIGKPQHVLNSGTDGGTEVNSAATIIDFKRTEASSAATELWQSEIAATDSFSILHSPFSISIKGRHDICLVPRIITVIESMIQLVLADAIAYQNLISLKENDLNHYREALDKIDEDILIALYRRFEIVKSIRELKKAENIPVKDAKREEQVMSNVSKFAQEIGLSEEFTKHVWELILKESKIRQM